MGPYKTPFWNAVHVWEGAICRLCAFFFLFSLLVLKILLVALKAKTRESFHWSNYSLRKCLLHLVCESSDGCLIGKVNNTSPQLFTVCSTSLITAGLQFWTIHLIAGNCTVLITTFTGQLGKRPFSPLKPIEENRPRTKMLLRQVKLSQEFYSWTIGRFSPFLNEHLLCMCITDADSMAGQMEE